MFSDALATKARVFRPEPSPTPTPALYVVTALDGDDDAGGSSSKEFVRIPRKETRADNDLDAVLEAGEKEVVAGLAVQTTDPASRRGTSYTKLRSH